jgi:hypothetical protein
LPAVSPDGRALQRLSCTSCGYTVATAIWCRDPQCCEQDAGRFVAALVPAGDARGMPVFAVRYLDPARAGVPGSPVAVWRGGDVTPVFTGPAGAATGFVLSHECQPG